MQGIKETFFEEKRRNTLTKKTIVRHILKRPARAVMLTLRAKAVDGARMNLKKKKKNEPKKIRRMLLTMPDDRKNRNESAEKYWSGSLCCLNTGIITYAKRRQSGLETLWEEILQLFTFASRKPRSCQTSAVECEIPLINGGWKKITLYTLPMLTKTLKTAKETGSKKWESAGDRNVVPDSPSVFQHCFWDLMHRKDDENGVVWCVRRL